MSFRVAFSFSPSIVRYYPIASFFDLVVVREITVTLDNPRTVASDNDIVCSHKSKLEGIS